VRAKSNTEPAWLFYAQTCYENSALEQALRKPLQKAHASVFDALANPVRAALPELGIQTPTQPQALAIPRILRGKNVLLISPTASGKTEATLLPVLSRLITNGRRKGIAVLYVTPLRALNRDLFKRATQLTAKIGVRCEIRHGDTPASQRRKQSKDPPEMLITTPETLQAILPSRAMRRHLRHVQTVVVDEIHELAEDKRGAQLTVALERLRLVTRKRFQRIGLSATVSDPERVAEFLAGSSEDCEIISVNMEKEAKYHVEYPYPTPEDHDLAQSLYTSPDAAARISRIKELVETHTSTLIFVNSRQHAEMLGLRLGTLDKRIAVHHGSLSREERSRIEGEFKAGSLRGIICTSTLELGIDIGTVDLTVQYMSPRQVSALIQRVGRSGHRLGRISEGVLICAYPEDVLESIAITKRAKKQQLEPMRIHSNALDVLAHQISGLLMDNDRVSLRGILSIVRRSSAFASLTTKELWSVVTFMEARGLLRKIGSALTRIPRTRVYYYQNLSMIPDERRYSILDVTTQRRVGILGEEFVLLHARKGVHFICRGRVWEITRVGEDGNIYVVPIEDPTAAIPGWDGEILPVPYEVAQEVGRIRGEVEISLKAMGKERTITSLCNYPIERLAAARITEEIGDYVKRGCPVPTDRTILVEAFGRYLIIHGSFGDAVNRTLAYAFDEFLTKRNGVNNVWVDGYRILIELPQTVSREELNEISKELFSMSGQEIDREFSEYAERRFPFAYNMKFIAQRFGAIPRGTFLSDRILLELSARFGSTPIHEETMREAKLTKVDLVSTKKLMRSIATGTVAVTPVLSDECPTPQGFYMLNKLVEVAEMVAPESTKKDNLSRMRASLLAQRVEFLCLQCGSSLDEERVEALPEFPKCKSCGSGLLALRSKVRSDILGILKKRKSGATLTEEEQVALSRARRTADLVLSYGRQAAIALLTWGVGPQTAAGVLAKMHVRDEDFYEDLLKAKLKYIQTRPFWD
jgi:ATP-dependent Lhr-like helicase